MIEGSSGAGKSSLALALCETARHRNLNFNFICDDQALLSVNNQRLWATTPPSIAGKIEVHGAGIATIPYIETCPIDLVCQLVDQQKITRLPPPMQVERLNIAISSVNLPLQHEAQSVRIILHKLGYAL